MSGDQDDLPYVYPLSADDVRKALAADPILRYFDHRHLPPRLSAVAAVFALTAYQVAMTLPRSAEKTVALRKLLEGKDAAVRAALDLTADPGPVFPQPGPDSR